MNKLNKTATAALALLLMLGTMSCKKEKTTAQGEKMTFEASIEQPAGADDKTYIDFNGPNNTGVMKWSEGDAIQIYSDHSGIDQNGKTFTLDNSYAGKTKGRFTGEYPGDGPYSFAYGNATRRSDGKFDFTIPTSQTGYFGDAGPMVAHSGNGNSIKFKCFMSWLQITLKADGSDVGCTEVRLTDLNGTNTKLNGTFTVDNSGSIVSRTGGNNYVSITGRTITTAGTTFSVNLPAGAFAGTNKVQIDVIRGSETIWSVTKSFWNADGIQPNTVHSATLKDKVSEAAEPGIQLWKGGPYWAECNLGATKPEESGDYYQWGEGPWGSRPNGWAAPYTIYSDKTATGFTFKEDGYSFIAEKAPYWTDGSSYPNITYSYNSPITNANDVAYKILKTDQGKEENWRIPTATELKNLMDNTTSKCEKLNGVFGVRFTGKGSYASKSIFLPVCGIGANSLIDSPNVYTWYISRDLYPNINAAGKALFIQLNGTNIQLINIDAVPTQRSYGMPIRPCYTKTK